MRLPGRTFSSPGRCAIAASSRRAVALVSIAAIAAISPTLGCATVRPYEPQLVARGEITLRYENGFEMSAGNRPLARGLEWKGLPEYVRCVPEAAKHAASASSAGTAAIVLSALGVSFGVASLGGFAGFGVADGKYLGAFLGTGVGVAILGTVFAGLSRSYKNRANGQAVDAMNLYNDSVGSLGATCDDLTYPPPVGPGPVEPPPPPPLPVPSAPPVFPAGDTPPTIESPESETEEGDPTE